VINRLFLTGKYRRPTRKKKASKSWVKIPIQEAGEGQREQGVFLMGIS